MSAVADKWAMDAVPCTVPQGKNSSSANCGAAKGETTLECNCGHPACASQKL